MPEYLAPGVFIEEIERGPKPIEGAATSTAAFIGVTERGSLTPKLVTGYSDYVRLFGSQSGPGEYMTDAVKSYFDNGGSRCFITRIVATKAVADPNNPTQTTPATFAQVDKKDITFRSAGPGDYGNNIAIRITPSTTKKFEVSPIPDPTPDDPNPQQPPPVETAIGFKLEIFYWNSRPTDEEAIKKVLEDATSPNQPNLVEVFDDLSFSPSSPDYWSKRVNGGNSVLIEMFSNNTSPNDSLTVEDIEKAENKQIILLPTNGIGKNDEVLAADFSSEIADESNKIKMGTAALELDPYREVAIVYAPFYQGEGESYLDIAIKVKDHCERNGFRFAVIDTDPNVSDIATLSPRNKLDSKYAAFYYPWIVASDPVLGGRKKIPPGGAMCGIYARTDNSRGVFKAPANETISGALSLEYSIDHASQEVLNPKGVNVIRQFPGRGIRIWGARTLSSDPLWKYVNVRRLFIFLEASIYNSTQWVVFEPNDQRLWARIKQTITLFLRTQWQAGALFGATEEEAFSVSVGRETMTQDDILNGRLIVEIGIAPVRPAEFVIFRVFQKTSEAN